jgi:preprotein translocase SecE subunit
MNALVTYLKHVREEFAHIVWPSNQTALGHTLVVILIAVVIAIIIAVLDYLFSGAVTKIVGA